MASTLACLRPGLPISIERSSGRLVFARVSARYAHNLVLVPKPKDSSGIHIGFANLIISATASPIDVNVPWTMMSVARASMLQS